MADVYHIFADHNENVDAKEFATKMRRFLDQMVRMKRMNSLDVSRQNKILNILKARKMI